jgi:hypothetical protein
VRISTKTAIALVAGLVAIVLVGGTVAVWASGPRPQAAMPAAWTAAPGSASPSSDGQHPTMPVATGNRGTTAARTSPTSNASMLTCSGGEVVSDAFSVKIPAGWMCWDERTTDDGKVVLNSTGGLDVIQITVTELSDPVEACRLYLGTQVTTVTPQPDTDWGGRPATTANVVVMAPITAQVRCAEWRGVVYLLAGLPEEGSLDTVVAGMDAMSSAWVWK